MPQPVPPWLSLALGELGVAEIPGPLSSSRILEYHACTTLRASTDEVAWCSSFAAWAMEGGALGHGIRSPRSAAARSWLSWGQPLKAPRLGAVAVFSRGNNPAQGHVGFVLDAFGSMIWLLSGNQGNRVSIAQFGVSRLLGYRWPMVAL